MRLRQTVLTILITVRLSVKTCKIRRYYDTNRIKTQPPFAGDVTTTDYLNRFKPHIDQRHRLLHDVLVPTCGKEALVLSHRHVSTGTPV